MTNPSDVDAPVLDGEDAGLVPSDPDALIPGNDDAEVRAKVYLAIVNHVRELTQGKPITRVSYLLGRNILVGVTEIIMSTALREGYFRLPEGYGSLRVKRLKPNPKPKRLPNGDMIMLPPNRSKLEYEDGAAVREYLKMPPKTSYRRRFQRESALSDKTQGLLGLSSTDEGGSKVDQ